MKIDGGHILSREGNPNLYNQKILIMETTFQSNNIHLAQTNKGYSHSEDYSVAKEKVSFLKDPANYYGVIAMTMLVGSMIGGSVAYFVLAYEANNFLFALNVGASMINNVAAIAQVEYNTILKIFSITTIINLLVFAIIVLS